MGILKRSALMGGFTGLKEVCIGIVKENHRILIFLSHFHHNFSVDSNIYKGYEM